MSRFPSGELVFNSYTRFAMWVAQHARGTKSVAGLVKFPGMDDAHVPEGWNPETAACRGSSAQPREPEIAEFPSAPSAVPPAGGCARRGHGSRTGTIVLALPLLKASR